MGSTMVAALSILLLAGPTDGNARDRLYGRVVTAGGEVYEGYLRWDRNEGSWADLLNGSKELPWENERDAQRLGGRDGPRQRRGRTHRISVLGLHISWTEDEEGDLPSSVLSGIRFGHLRSLAVTGDQRALLTLKSGEEVELEGGSTDLGDDLRGLVVEDPERGEVDLGWRDLDQVEFMPAPPDAARPEAARLYGTLRTRSGLSFTGYVAWDVDEILGSDVLDGSEHGRGRKIRFDLISAIEREGPESARVVLRNGEEVVLRGGRGVGAGSGGVAISDPGLGQASVAWRDFESLTLQDAPERGGGYDAFDGGYPLFGTVEDQDGQRYTGRIRWDNDEANSWEILDGNEGDAELDVELGQVASIARTSGRGAEVTLRDGRVLEMQGSNDVDQGNRGVFVVLEDGETVMVPWRDFHEVVFQAP